MRLSVRRERRCPMRCWLNKLGIILAAVLLSASCGPKVGKDEATSKGSAQQSVAVQAPVVLAGDRTADLERLIDALASSYKPQQEQYSHDDYPKDYDLKDQERVQK